MCFENYNITETTFEGDFTAKMNSRQDQIRQRSQGRLEFKVGNRLEEKVFMMTFESVSSNGDSFNKVISLGVRGSLDLTVEDNLDTSNAFVIMVNNSSSNREFVDLEELRLDIVN